MISCGGEGHLVKIVLHFFTVGRGEGGKLVAEVFEGEFEAVGNADGVLDGSAVIGEEVSHLHGGVNVALGVFGEEAAGLIECRVMTKAGEGVGDDAIGRRGVAGAAGGEEWKFLRSGEVDELLDAEVFAAEIAALEFDADVVGAEEVFESRGGGFGGGAIAVGESTGDGAVFVASEGNEAFGMRSEFFPRGEARAFAKMRIVAGGEVVGVGTEIGWPGFFFRQGDETAEVFVAGAVFDEHGERGAIGEGDLSADASGHVVFARGLVGTRGTVDAVAVEDGDLGKAGFVRGAEDALGIVGATEEVEGAGGVELDIIGGAHGAEEKAWRV
jgi:hypothetical protein